MHQNNFSPVMEHYRWRMLSLRRQINQSNMWLVSIALGLLNWRGHPSLSPIYYMAMQPIAGEDSPWVKQTSSSHMTSHNSRNMVWNRLPGVIVTGLYPNPIISSCTMYTNGQLLGCSQFFPGPGLPGPLWRRCSVDLSHRTQKFCTNDNAQQKQPPIGRFDLYAS